MTRTTISVNCAVRQYREQSVSLARAAELAGVSIWRFIDVLDERSVELNYDESDLESDLRAVRETSSD